MAKILILGGGFGGLAAAESLAPALAAGHTITLIDRRERFFIGLAKLWILVGERAPDRGFADRNALNERGVRFVQAEVTAIDPAARTVKTGDGERHGYDHLVLALGATLAPEAIPGLPPENNLYELERLPDLCDQLENLERGKVAILVCRPPYKCPPAPFECSMLVDARLRGRGVRDAVSIDIYFPGPIPMKVAGPIARAKMGEQLEQRGIGLHPSFKVTQVDALARELAFENGERRTYDLLLAIPPHRAPQVVRDAGLCDDSGWVRVDPATLVPRAAPDRGIYAIGDNTQIDLPEAGLLPKAGIMAERQAEVVAARILAELEGRAADAEFDGNGYCFMETGNHQAMVAEGVFYQPPGDRVTLADPSDEAFTRKQAFEADRLRRFLGGEI